MTMPSIFVAHGAPPLLDDAAWMGELRRWADAMPRPKAILVMSAHWERRPLAVGATKPVPLVYDFYGFPQRYYEIAYPSPGAPELASRVRELVGAEADESRGLDHGVYVPLMAMYPKADVPVLQVSIPTLDPAALVELGRKLAPLRDEGALFVGSGFLVHNLRAIGRSAPWATEFDAWAAEKLAARDVDALVKYRAQAPGVAMALPTHEHFVPVLVALGTSIDRSEPVTFPITGTWYGSFTKRSVQFG
jgi:4,5-DOPA dioxygenase extradiol